MNLRDFLPGCTGCVPLPCIFHICSAASIDLCTAIQHALLVGVCPFVPRQSIPFAVGWISSAAAHLASIQHWMVKQIVHHAILLKEHGPFCTMNKDLLRFIIDIDIHAPNKAG